MAEVTLADIIDLDDFSSYLIENDTEKSALVQSGAVARNEFLDNLARGVGDNPVIPFWKDVDPEEEANVSSDNCASKATPCKITASSQTGSKAYLNKVYASADLVFDLSSEDPLARIENRVSDYWAWQLNQRAFATLEGIKADDTANDASSMSNITATPFDGAGFIDAIGTAGDSMMNTGVVIMHSAIYRDVLKADQIDFEKESAQSVQIPFYKGFRVLQDDRSTENLGVYTTYILAEGALGLGVANPKMPVEIEREALAGDGGGCENFVTRREWLLHPLGFSYQRAVQAGASATQADLADATNWDKVFDRKNIPIAFYDATLAP